MGAYNFQGKVAVVSGGRRGIGYAIARGLYDAGARLIVIGKSEYTPNGGVSYYRCDLSDAYERTGIIESIAKTNRRIDILVNNAGDNFYSPAETHPLAEWNRLMELMLTAPFDLAQQAFPYMKAQGGGKIINISSVAGLQGTRNTAAYSTAKHGLIGLTKCLSNEWTPYGINVNCVAPGWTDTDMQADLMADDTHYKAMLGRIPAGRFATPDEIANAVLWLASDESKYVCGSTLVVDGGWMAR